MTNLGNFSGTSDDKGRGNTDTVFGGCFKPIEYNHRYYETTIPYLALSPWLGSPFEGTFLNALKRANEPPVKTYKDLVLFPIPTNKFERIEGFSGNQTFGLTNLVVLMIIIVLIYYIINK